MENDKCEVVASAIITFAIGLVIGIVIMSIITDNRIKTRDKEIEELKTENAVLKEENQDIMGLWSDLVIKK
jgi:uncharacterized membrane-anchored protein YhcB (DUF1043 family)